MKEGELITVSATVGTSSTTIYSVPKGHIFEIESITVQKDSNAGTFTLTDEGTYKDDATAYTNTLHKQYLAANEFDDTRDFSARAYADIKGVSSSGNTDIVIKGRLI